MEKVNSFFNKCPHNIRLATGDHAHYTNTLAGLLTHKTTISTICKTMRHTTKHNTTATCTATCIVYP